MLRVEYWQEVAGFNKPGWYVVRFDGNSSTMVSGPFADKADAILSLKAIDKHIKTYQTANLPS